METSIIIARILGVIYIAFALGVLLDWKRYKEVITHLIDNVGYLVLAGIIAAAMGVLILSVMPGLPRDWTSIIRVMAWIAVFKGIFLIAYPHKMYIYKPLLEIGFARWMIAVLAGFLGTLFIYFGFLN